MIIFSGCQKEPSVPALNSKYETAYNYCQSKTLYENLTKIQEDSLNTYLNLALYKMQMRDFDKSNEYFDLAIKKYRFFENKGQISASRMLSYMNATLLSDNYLDYEGDGYEKVLMHNYKAINYLLQDNPESARVEIMNSYQKQMEEKKKFDEEISEYKKEEIKQIEVEEKKPKRKRKYKAYKSTIYDKLKPLFYGVASHHMPYQNPFAYYLSALVYEENGEYDEAYIDVKKALSYYPESEVMQNKLVYYAKKAYGDNSSEYMQAKERFTDIGLDDERVEIFFEVGRSPKKEEMKVPVPLGGAMQFVAFPTFIRDNINIGSIAIEDENGKVVSSASMVSDNDAIVINTFKERVSGIILRQVLNVGGKTFISNRITDSISNNNIIAGAAVSFGMSYINYMTSKADLRGWNALPAQVYALSLSFESLKLNKKNIVLRSHDGTLINKYPLEFKNKNLKNKYISYNVQNGKICELR
jgi:hypothetical protein